MNTYVHIAIFFVFFINLQKCKTYFFHVVIIRYCLQNVEENNEFNLFWNKAVTIKMWKK